MVITFQREMLLGNWNQTLTLIFIEDLWQLVRVPFACVPKAGTMWAERIQFMNFYVVTFVEQTESTEVVHAELPSTKIGFAAIAWAAKTLDLTTKTLTVGINTFSFYSKLSDTPLVLTKKNLIVVQSTYIRTLLNCFLVLLQQSHII